MPFWNASHAKLAAALGAGIVIGGGTNEALRGDRIATPAPVEVAPAVLPHEEPLDPSLDGDQDSIPDFRDACPLSPRGTTVDKDGCPPPPRPPKPPAVKPKRKG